MTADSRVGEDHLACLMSSQPTLEPVNSQPCRSAALTTGGRNEE